MTACPFRCLILRTNGELSVLDLDDGREKELTDSIELFWVTCGQSDEKTNLIGEVSWLDYGHRGMQVTVTITISKFSFSSALVFPNITFKINVIFTGLVSFFRS